MVMACSFKIVLKKNSMPHHTACILSDLLILDRFSWNFLTQKLLFFQHTIKKTFEDKYRTKKSNLHNFSNICGQNGNHNWSLCRYQVIVNIMRFLSLAELQIILIQSINSNNSNKGWSLRTRRKEKNLQSDFDDVFKNFVFDF